MKADIITLHAINNYGSVLQAYATQELFEAKGVNINIINYIREDVLPNNILKSNGANSLFKKIILLPSIKKQNYIFDNFRTEYLNLTEKKYITKSDFDNYKSDADFFVTGSDQVWNSTWNKGIILPLYLSFISSKPKISYSASFGKESITKNEIELTQKYINEYMAISVREKSAIDIIKNQYKYNNVVQILDPTLVLPKEFWKKFSNKGKKYKNYVLIYQLNRNKDFDHYASQIAKRLNCNLIRICRGYHQILLNGKSVVIPSVETFVSLFDNATFVVTDSFHALSFCTNLNIPFACIFPNNFNTRLKSHLEMFELVDRHIDNYNNFEILNKKIDWGKVNSILEEKRIETHKYVDNCLKNILKGKKDEK